MDGNDDIVARLQVVEKDFRLAKWIRDLAASTIEARAERDATIERLTKERDEADRRAGAAERRNEDLQDSYSKRQSWLWKAKESEGFSQNGSFDDLWAKVRRERDEARAEVERKDAALAPFADMADYIDAETEGVSDADEVDVMFHDFLFAHWPVSHFRCARAALTAKGGENAER